MTYLAYMSRWHSYLNSAAQVLNAYKGEEPFANYLRNFFSRNKKMGAGDRKWISQLCYSYFRLGKACNDLPVEERILLAFFLCTNKTNPLLENIRSNWNAACDLPIEEKCKLSGICTGLKDVFPWSEELSPGIDHLQFCESFFEQPDLYLRVRPGKMERVLTRLNEHDIEIREVGPNSLAFANGSKIDKVLEFDEEVVVQDLSSQKTVQLVERLQPTRAWDCCAASGGKSIMLYDAFPDIELTVTDIRESILKNLRERFRRAGVTNYHSFVADLSNAGIKIDRVAFPLILADVPCTGSGTWSRTPEQLYYFDKEKIDQYADLQQRIVSNVIPYLERGGFLLYITCSVFRKENEDNVSLLQRQHGLELIRTELFKGYDRKADTLFGALMRKRPTL